MDWERYQILALSAVLDSREDYLFRKVCRDYSSRFYTPLHEVYKLPFHFVLKNWMESQIESLNSDSLIQLAQDVVGLDESEENLIQEQIKMWEKEYSKKTNVKKNKEPIQFEEKTLDFSNIDSDE